LSSTLLMPQLLSSFPLVSLLLEQREKPESLKCRKEIHHTKLLKLKDSEPACSLISVSSRKLMRNDLISTYIITSLTIFISSSNLFLVAEPLYIWYCLSVHLSQILSLIFINNFVPDFLTRLCNSCSIQAYSYNIQL
jgi:hypothetical protein